MKRRSMLGRGGVIRAALAIAALAMAVLTSSAQTVTKTGEVLISVLVPANSAQACVVVLEQPNCVPLPPGDTRVTLKFTATNTHEAGKPSKPFLAATATVARCDPADGDGAKIRVEPKANGTLYLEIKRDNVDVIEPQTVPLPALRGLTVSVCSAET